MTEPTTIPPGPRTQAERTFLDRVITDQAALHSAAKIAIEIGTAMVEQITAGKVVDLDMDKRGALTSTAANVLRLQAQLGAYQTMFRAIGITYEQFTHALLIGGVGDYHDRVELESAWLYDAALGLD